MRACHFFCISVVNVIFFHRCAAVAAGYVSVHISIVVLWWYKAYELERERVLVFTGKATIYLSLVTTRTNRVAEAVLCKSIREHLLWYLHTITLFAIGINPLNLITGDTFIYNKNFPGRILWYIKLTT